MTRRTLAGALGATALAPVATRAADGDFEREQAASLLDRFVRSTDLARTPGVSAAVVLADGRSATAAFGWSDRERREPMTPDTRLLSEDADQLFCATLVLSLAQDGQLDLDEPLAPAFADEPWFGRLPNTAGLTLRHLITHQAGRPHLSRADQAAAASPRELLSRLGDRPPAPAPGVSDLAHTLVGVLLEKTTGRGYYDLLQARVLARCPASTIVPAAGRRVPGLACWHGPAEQRPPHGALAMTATDLATFYGRLVRGEIVEMERLGEARSATGEWRGAARHGHFAGLAFDPASGSALAVQWSIARGAPAQAPFGTLVKSLWPSHIAQV